MDERKNNTPETWDPDFYETGSTRPPKSHRGLITLLMVLVILLGGISSALGIMNIKLGIQLQSGTDSSYPIDFSPTGGQQITDPFRATDDPTVPVNGGDVTMELNPTPDSVENIPQAGGLSYQQIYAKVIESVVSISCSISGGTSSGTGVIFSADGYIVTNCHVIDGAQAIRVRLTDDRILTAAVVGADNVSDLAVLYVEADNLTAAEFGDSSALRVGDAVAAIGDPLGEALRGTMTDGIVSAINRDVSIGGRNMTLIQTNAALNSGNSGGPLLNCYGQVIGINTMKISAFVDTAGVEGLGFAIPSSIVKSVVEQLLAQGYVSGRPDAGMEYDAVTLMEQQFYRLPAGLLVTSVEENGPAARAELQEGDILLSIDNIRITETEEINSILYSHEVGDTLQVTFYRRGRQYSTELTLDENKG